MKNITSILIIILTSFSGISQIESNLNDTLKSSLDSIDFKLENTFNVSTKNKSSGFASGTSYEKGEGPALNNKRLRLNDPNLSDITSETNATINLLLRIDEDGNVRAAKSTTQTSTKDQILINKVIAAIIKQVKYSKKSGSGFEDVLITININAN